MCMIQRVVCHLQLFFQANDLMFRKQYLLKNTFENHFELWFCNCENENILNSFMIFCNFVKNQKLKKRKNLILKNVKMSKILWFSIFFSQKSNFYFSRYLNFYKITKNQYLVLQCDHLRISVILFGWARR